MIHAILSLYFSLAQPSTDHHLALVCEVAICCDYCQPIGGNGLGYCRGCEGAGGDGCDTGQTSLKCPPGSCYSGAAKLNTGSLGPDACK